MDAYVHPWLQPVLGNPFLSVRELPTRCNWTSWFDNTQKRLDVVRDVRAQNSRPAPPRPAPCAVHGSVTMPSTRESGCSVDVGGGLARASCASHRCAHTFVHLGCGCGCERVGVQGFKSERCARW